MLPFDSGKICAVLYAVKDPDGETLAPVIQNTTTTLTTFLKDSVASLPLGGGAVTQLQGDVTTALGKLQTALGSAEFRQVLTVVLNLALEEGVTLADLPPELVAGKSLLYDAGCDFAQSVPDEVFSLDISDQECAAGTTSLYLGNAVVPVETRPAGLALKLDYSDFIDADVSPAFTYYLYLLDRGAQTCLGQDLYLTIGFPANGRAVPPLPPQVRFGLTWPSANTDLFCQSSHNRDVSGWGFSVGPFDYALSYDSGSKQWDVVGTDISWYVTTPTVGYSFLLLSVGFVPGG